MLDEDGMDGVGAYADDGCDNGCCCCCWVMSGAGRTSGCDANTGAGDGCCEGG